MYSFFYILVILWGRSVCSIWRQAFRASVAGLMTWIFHIPSDHVVSQRWLKNNRAFQNNVPASQSSFTQIGAPQANLQHGTSLSSQHARLGHQRRVRRPPDPYWSGCSLYIQVTGDRILTNEASDLHLKSLLFSAFTVAACQWTQSRSNEFGDITTVYCNLPTSARWLNGAWRVLTNLYHSQRCIYIGLFFFCC